MDEFDYKFDGRIELLDYGRMAFSVIYAPKARTANAPRSDTAAFDVATYDYPYFEAAGSVE
ncbi:MAG: hypothetical protein AAF664_10470, partial [Planctomycetota bacterium]